ncbi:hypothetical protein XELAEV_18004311mg [Xenopus laevis]|uniref:Uncharacterized protein n=1 Tax=Xenopus laevis TaxID=8355 RepID=A0A974BP94_XENLA|nr:hypothetical protein XELAEV_18004311mg [Xenopus laevis]
MAESQHPDREVFSYTESQAEEIVASFAQSAGFLRVPVSSQLQRKLEGLNRRAIDLELHAETLAEYFMNKRIPRGMRISLRPTLFAGNDEFRLRFAQILNKCSYDIMTLTVGFIAKELKIVHTETQKVSDQLATGFSAQEFNDMKEQIQIKLDKYKQENEKQKRQKFDRDTTDYERGRVYQWNRIDGNGRGTARSLSVPRNMERSIHREETQDKTSGSSRPFLDVQGDAEVAGNMGAIQKRILPPRNKQGRRGNK